jgi:hypothetical protein
LAQNDVERLRELFHPALQFLPVHCHP